MNGPCEALTNRSLREACEREGLADRLRKVEALLTASGQAPFVTDVLRWLEFARSSDLPRFIVSLLVTALEDLESVRIPARRTPAEYERVVFQPKPDFSPVRERYTFPWTGEWPGPRAQGRAHGEGTAVHGR
ncbi:MAG: hypothetical protein H0U67_15700 [Gemmatimonadetes bacterium]|nr:hypothetical protein [Gemmatimonadota bacterium]